MLSETAEFPIKMADFTVKNNVIRTPKKLPTVYKQDMLFREKFDVKIIFDLDEMKVGCQNSLQTCETVHKLIARGEHEELFTLFKKTVIRSLVCLTLEFNKKSRFGIESLAVLMRENELTTDICCPFLKQVYNQTANIMIHCLSKSRAVKIGLKGLDNYLMENLKKDYVELSNDKQSLQ